MQTCADMRQVEGHVRAPGPLVGNERLNARLLAGNGIGKLLLEGSTARLCLGSSGPQLLLGLSLLVAPGFLHRQDGQLDWGSLPFLDIAALLLLWPCAHRASRVCVAGESAVYAKTAICS